MKVEYIDHMGSDDRIADVARVSFDKRAETYPPDANHRLIQYLAANGHWSPFASCMLTLRFTAPIAIHAQAAKHTVGFVMNTVSRRYVSTTPEYDIPVFRYRHHDKKQGSGEVIPHQEGLQSLYEKHMEAAIYLYDKLLVQGVAPEQARFVLPQGVMTQWVWTGSLAAYARFYNLRADSHAQKEIQELAHMVSDIIAPLYPVSWAALTGETE